MRTRIFHKGGFEIWDTVMRKGDKKTFTFANDVQRSDLNFCTLFVKGRFIYTDDNGKFVTERTHGSFTEERPNDIKAGTYHFECMEDGSRWFCVNGRVPFGRKLMRVDEGCSNKVDGKEMFLLCSGSMDATWGVLRETKALSPRDFIDGAGFGCVLRGTAPTSLGIVLWR